MKSSSTKDTQFLNVDLDVYSRSDLQSLTAALGKKSTILYSGRERGMSSLHLELNRQFKNADQCICAFAELILRLPRSIRRHWEKAVRRDFNIGVRSLAQEQQPFVLALSCTTLKTIASLNARVILTVYGPQNRSGIESRAFDRAKRRDLARLKEGYDLRWTPPQSRDELHER